MVRGMKTCGYFLRAGMAAAALVLWGCGSGGEIEEGKDAKELIREGWTSYRLNEFKDAILKFEAARKGSAEGSEDWAMATYGEGITWDLQRPGEDPKKAKALFEEALEKAPESKVAPWTELALVRQKHLVPVGQEPDYDEVKAGFQHIMDAYPGHLAAKEAFLYLEGIKLSELEPESSEAAAAELLDFIRRSEEAGVKEFISPAWSLLTVAYVTTGDQEARLHAEEESFENVETDPLDPSVEYAWAYWNLGTIAEFEVGDFELARKYYKGLLAEYPTDIRVHGCKAALARMDALEAELRAELAAEAVEPKPAEAAAPAAAVEAPAEEEGSAAAPAPAKEKKAKKKKRAPVQEAGENAGTEGK